MTRHARKNTPKLGKKKDKQRSAQHLKQLLKEQNILPIVLEPIQEEALIAEDVLYVKLLLNMFSSNLLQELEMSDPSRGLQSSPDTITDDNRHAAPPTVIQK